MSKKLTTNKKQNIINKLGEKKGSYLISSLYYEQAKYNDGDSPRVKQRCHYFNQQGAHWLGRSFVAGNEDSYFDLSTAMRYQHKSLKLKKQAKEVEKYGIPPNKQGYKKLMEMGLKVMQKDICWAMSNAIQFKNDVLDDYCALRIDVLNDLNIPLDNHTNNLMMLGAALDQHPSAAKEIFIRMTRRHEFNNNLFSLLDDNDINPDSILKFSAQVVLNSKHDLLNGARNYVEDFRNILDVDMPKKRTMRELKTSLISTYLPL